jgi:glycosyltransferase involved in cell wall biosynthesis
VKIAYIVLKGMPLGGGIEKYTEEVGSRLARMGHEVIVYAMRHHGASDGLYRGMTVKTVPAVRTKSLEKMTAALIASLMVCGERGVDIAHFHAFGPAMFCLMPRLMGIKTVVQGHGLEWKRSRWGPPGRLFLRLSEIPSVRLPDAVTVVSEVQRGYLMKSYGIESVRIPTGVNPPERVPPGLIEGLGLKGGDYVLFAARLVREKGAHYLIDAFGRLDTGLKLVIAGDAAHEDAYKGELKRLADRDRRVVFTGMATGRLLSELYSNCRIFVLPSEVEGLPTALLEAMSYGNCCLASDIPENIEALNNDGYTFRSKDASDLAARLDFLIRDSKAADRVKAGARERVLRDHSWDDIAARLEGLYAGLLGRAPARNG